LLTCSAHGDPWIGARGRLDTDGVDAIAAEWCGVAW
jgi:hypothetical protein